MKDESGAADKILADVKKISLANDIKAVFEDCKKAYDGVPSTEKSGLEDKLKGHKTSRKPAWDKVNAYEKTTGEKYADKALEKVKEGRKKDQAAFDDLVKNSSTPAEVRTRAAEKGEEDETLIKRAQVKVKFKGSSEDRKKKLETIVERVGETTKYSDSKDKIAQSITDIKAHIDLLDKLIKAKNTDSSDEGKLRKELEQIDDK